MSKKLLNNKQNLLNKLCKDKQILSMPQLLNFPYSNGKEKNKIKIYKLIKIMIVIHNKI